jgi:hypothetical protein
MSKLTARLRVLGNAQRHLHVLPKMAVLVATAAKNREVSPEDTLEIYTAYYKAASPLKTIDPYSAAVRVNVSKLRQIIKARDPELLRKVMVERDKLMLQGKDVKPLYHAMVDVCRAANNSPRALTLEMIDKVIRR